MKKLKKIIGTIAIGAYMTLVNAVPALAANVNTEVMNAQNQTTQVQTTTIDTKIGGEIGDVGYFMRSRIGINHANEDNVDLFSMIDLSYPLGKGFNLMTEIQFTPGSPVDPRAGMFWAGNAGPIALYAQLTRNWSANPNTEFFGTATFAPEGKGLKPYLHTEAFFNFSDEEYRFDGQKVRLGGSYKGISFGPALNISGLASEEPSYDVGAFVKVKVK